MIRLAEDLLFFAAEKTGLMTFAGHDALRGAFAGSLLMDLALENRIDSDLERVLLVDATPLDDDLLDPVLSLIGAEDETHDAAWWVGRIGHPEVADDLLERGYARLIERDILARDAEGNLTVADHVIRTRRYPGMSGEDGRDADLRVMSILFTKDVPEPRDAMLVAMADVCGLIQPLLSMRERSVVEERLDLIRRLDLVGRAVTDMATKEEEQEEEEQEDAPRARRRSVGRSLMDGIRGALSFTRSEEDPPAATDDAGELDATADDDAAAPTLPTFAEELLVFLLDKHSGHLAPVPERTLHYALAGAVLMDLALENRIDTDLERLLLVDSTRIGNQLLDPALAMIAADAEDHDTAYWVERLGTPEFAGGIQEGAIARLIKRGILERDVGGFLSVTRLVRRAQRYPTVHGQAGREVEARIMGILFADDIPDPRDAMLIAIVDACGIFERVLSPEERVEVADRIDLLRNLDLIGRTIGEAIRDLDAEGAPAPTVVLGPAERARALAEQPIAPGGVPVLGHERSLAKRPIAFLAKQYQALGPVFRVRVPGGPMTVLAGPEANHFIEKEGRLCLRSHATDPRARRLGAHLALLDMDGNEHFRLRKVMTKSLSPTHILTNLDAACDVAGGELADWAEGEPMPVLPALRRIFVEQTARVCAGTSALEWVDDLTHHIDATIAGLGRRSPKRKLNNPRARRARDGALRLAERVLNTHDPDRRGDAEPDMVDDMIELHRADPQLLPQNELRQTVLTPFLAGLHTAAATAGFMLYEVLRNPEIRDAARAEADELFAGEGPTPDKLRGMDVTHRAMMETLRLYPVGGVLLRNVVNTFELAGHTIPFGEQIMVAVTVPHLCEQFFPDPTRFDIDRYLPERNEHRQPGAYAPFGAGTHRCLGSGFTEVQVALTTATLLHRADLALDPPGFKLKAKYQPLLTPPDAFRIKVAPRN